MKLVDKTFAFYRKSAKTAKVLYRRGFVVYGTMAVMILQDWQNALQESITIPYSYVPRKSEGRNILQLEIFAKSIYRHHNVAINAHEKGKQSSNIVVHAACVMNICKTAKALP